MDITNIPQTLMKGLEQKNTDQLVALSSVLNLVLGKTVIATVSSTEPVTAPERAELLKQTAAALAQIKQQATNNLTPAVKAEIARLVQQQNLIQSPELKWVNLVVNNRPLLTYSDKPLVAGQSVPVQLQSPQKLVLLDLPTPILPTKAGVPSATLEPSLAPIINTPTNATANTTKNAAVLNTLLKAAITELANKTLATQTTAPETSIKNSLPTNSSATLLSKTLATTEDANNTSGLKNSAALNELSKTAITSSPTSLLKNILTTAGANNLSPEASIASPDTHTKAAALGKAINYSTNDLSLKYTSHSSHKNTNPETLAVKNIVSENLRNLLPHRDAPSLLLSAINQLQQLPATSRQQLLSPSIEQALKSIAEKIRSPEQLAHPKVLAQTLKNSGVFFEHRLSQSLQKNSDNNTENAKANVNTTYTQDLKGSLLTLLSRATQELNGDKKPLSNEQTIKLLQTLSTPALFQPTGAASTNPLNANIHLAQTIGMFVQQLMHKPVKELSDKELRTQLLVLLQQHSVHSLAKIQLQQLHSINHELETKDSATPNASWQIEIPVKHHNDVHHLHMRIDREWVDEKNESETNKNTNKIKQWSVTLRFDLPTLGEFCAQLSIINTQVSATLWAAREKTFGEVRDHIDGLRKQLESEGIEVKYLQCMRGMPPEKPMNLSYSLIDIST